MHAAEDGAMGAVSPFKDPDHLFCGI